MVWPRVAFLGGLQDGAHAERGAVIQSRRATDHYEAARHRAMSTENEVHWSGEITCHTADDGLGGGIVLDLPPASLAWLLRLAGSLDHDPLDPHGRQALEPFARDVQVLGLESKG